MQTRLSLLLTRSFLLSIAEQLQSDSYYDERPRDCGPRVNTEHKITSRMMEAITAVIPQPLAADNKSGTEVVAATSAIGSPQI